MGGGTAESREWTQIPLSGRDVLQAFPALREGIAPDEAPIAGLLLGGMAYADDDFAQARRHWEQAYHRLRTDGDLCGAARAAINLADLHTTALGNRAAGRGWIGRATRLLDRVGHCVEWGYLALALTACDVSDISAVEGAAATALDLAIEFGDADLEVRALADGGFALVSQGRLREGFARLDEAMAAISAGEVRQLSVAGKSFCAMLSACELADIVCHGDDIRLPLGFSRNVPPASLLVAAEFLKDDRATGTPKRIKGLRLKATDAEWSIGEGPVVEGPLQLLVLAMAGRADALEELSGEGLAELSTRIGTA